MQSGSPLAENGRSVWQEIKKRGGLDLRRGRDPYDGYDVPLEDAINAMLFPGSPASLTDNLTARPGTSEEFLAAFFVAQKPFSLMMTEVLGFFERANARYGDDNLRIAFNFEKGKELTVNLRHFREWEAFLQKIAVERSTWEWSIDALWQLTNSLVALLGLSYPSELPDPTDPSVRQWVDRGKPQDWSDPPRIPSSGNDGFDRIVRQCQRLLDGYRAACRAIAPNREAFIEVGRQAMRDLSATDVEVARGAERIYALWQPETDFWAKTFAKAVTAAVEQVEAGVLIPSPGFFANYEAALTSMDRGSIIADELREAFRELLNLPIWQRRHELYAVWVGSQIAGALDDVQAVYHVVDGVLRFPFSGAHLATFIDRDSDILMFWTELRSRLTANSLVGRKNIQPDYRVVKLPFEPERNTTLVVECKQYRRSSLGEFSNALNDYARGCPNAVVILVNNGPIGPGLTNRIDPRHADRTHAVSEFRPDNPGPLTQFRSLVRSSVLGPEPESDDHPEIAEDEPLQGIIRLNWDDQFADLDLIVRFTPSMGLGEHTVSYSARGSRDTWPRLYLDEDVQAGPGEEIVRSDSWKPGTYDVFVHNYSDDRCPAAVGVKVTVHHPHYSSPLFIDGERVPAGRGSYWHVCEVDGATGHVKRFQITGDESVVRAHLGRGTAP
jgi:hypothetical protein